MLQATILNGTPFCAPTTQLRTSSYPVAAALLVRAPHKQGVSCASSPPRGTCGSCQPQTAAGGSRTCSQAYACVWCVWFGGGEEGEQARLGEMHTATSTALVQQRSRAAMLAPCLLGILAQGLAHAGPLAWSGWAPPLPPRQTRRASPDNPRRVLTWGCRSRPHHRPAGH